MDRKHGDLQVSVVDRHDNLCPEASDLIRIKVRGAGRFVALANGDPTCLEPFQEPRMHAFGGKMSLIVSSSDKSGEIRVNAFSKGLRSAKLSLFSH